MSRTPSDAGPKVTAELIAEAAAWVAVLHGPNRTTATERGFSQWMKRSVSHSLAFEEATSIWEEARNLPRPNPLYRSFRQRPARRIGFLKSAIVAATLAVFAVGATIYLQRQAGIGTKIGEQRVLVLDDGSRVILNTDTRVVVSFNREARRVELKEGEALFEVAKNASWPFIVTAGDRQIEALGTAFVVRRDDQRLTVTLVEGKISVSTPASGPSQLQANPGGGSQELPGAGAVILTPGERVVFNETSAVKRDRPQLEKLLAWQHREVAFDNTALPDAVAEMNRYNRKPVEIASAEATKVRVTGLFRAGDSMSFARAVAEAYHLDVNENTDRITLAGVPTERHTSTVIQP